MIQKDQERDHELWRNRIEYLASYSHGDAVKANIEARDRNSNRTFATDDEFNEAVQGQGYKDLLDRYSDAVAANLQGKDTDANQNRKSSLGSIAKIVKDFK